MIENEYISWTRSLLKQIKMWCAHEVCFMLIYWLHKELDNWDLRVFIFKHISRSIQFLGENEENIWEY